MALEVFPDLNGVGNGYLHAGWFTFDTAAGGAESQRWYTLAGAMIAGAASAPVTIHNNLGGNFNAAPITTATPVGTGVLAFSDCATGHFAYTFTDGSGRTGTISLTRIMANIECSTATTRTHGPDLGYSGSWYDPATSGQGLFVEANPVTRALFIAWYTYAPNASGSGAAGQRWYTAQGTFVAGTRSIALTLFETTGELFDTTTNIANNTIGRHRNACFFELQHCVTELFGRVGDERWFEWNDYAATRRSDANRMRLIDA